MKIRIPYLNSLPEKDLLLTFLLTPLWWVLGFNIFVYQLVTYVAFVKLMAVLLESNRSLKIPVPALWFGLFLLSFASSIIINIPNYPIERIFSSANHWLIFIMGFLLTLIVYHLDSRQMFLEFSRICWILCGVTGFSAIAFLSLWFLGYKNVEFPSLVGLVAPSLNEYPFFSLFTIVRLISSDWLSVELPRLSVYSAVQTATGGFLIMILPLGIAYLRLKNKNIWVRLPVLAASSIALFFSLSRTAICAFFAAASFVWFLEKRNKMSFSLIALMLTFFTSGKIYEGLIWLLNLRLESTIGRLEIYSDALKILREENPIMGVGVRPRNEFTMMAVGSHSTYLGILLVAGFLGLILFTLFQFTIFSSWLKQKSFMKDQEQRTAWRYLGISFIGSAIWFLTDTLDTLPFVAYTYFLIVASILSLGRSSRVDHEYGLS